MKLTEKLIILFSLLVFGGSAYFFFFDKEKKETTQGETINFLATVGELTNESRRKRDEGVGWENIQEGDKLFPKDTVLTLDESFLRLDFEGGAVINLTPNTLVYLLKESENLDVDLKKGFLGLNLKSMKNKIAIKVGKNVLGIKSPKAKVHVSMEDAKKANFSVVDGIASISFKGKIAQMEKGQKVSIDQDTKELAVENYGINPETPDPGKVIFKDGQSVVPLAWDTDLQVDDFQVLAARDPQFKSIVSRLSTKDRKVEIEVDEEGQYFWVVKGRKRNKVMSEGPISSFSVWSDFPPHLVAPGPQRQISLKRNEEFKDVTLRWERQRASEYEVEFFRNGLGQGNAESFTLKDNFITVKQLTPKEYRWRVRVKDKKRPHSPWSEYRTFAIRSFRARGGPGDNKGPKRKSEYFDENTGEWVNK